MKFRILILLVSAFWLVACGSGPAVKGDRQRALDNYVELGLNYLSEGNRDQARQNLLRALEIDSNSASANNGIALLYQVDRELDLAESHFNKALKTDKNFTQARNNYARFLYMEGRHADARDQYKLVTEDVNYRLRSQGFIGLALSEKALGNIGSAEAALQRSLSLNPRNALAALELTQLKYDQKDYVTSKEYLDRFEATSRSTARSLSLGIQLAEKFGDDKSREGYAMALKNMFPESREARELMLSEQGNN